MAVPQPCCQAAVFGNSARSGPNALRTSRYLSPSGRPRLRVLICQRSLRCPSWVKSPRSPGVPSESEAEGRPDLPGPWAELRFVATSSPCWRSRQSQSARTKFAIPFSILLSILGYFAPGVALSQPVAAECWHDGAQSRKCYLQSPVTDRATVAPSR